MRPRDAEGPGPGAGLYLALVAGVSLRGLEAPYLYDRRTDELYELNDEAWGFLRTLDGETAGQASRGDPGFVEYLVEEGLAAFHDRPTPGRVPVGCQPAPSLRYLELYVTERCNLRCGHCFLGELGRTDLPLDAVHALLDEFDRMGGLRLLLTGGEALLHPDFWEIDRAVAERGFRTVLLTNGTLLAEAADRLSAQEVQVSLDGLEDAHDRLRGRGAFGRARRGIDAAREAGLDVSVATTVNRLNRGDFDGLGQLVRDVGARAWHIDAPSECGTLSGDPGLILPPHEVAPYLDLAFGGGVHDAVAGEACGSHLMAVFPDGTAAKCGFYREQPVGRVVEGLQVLWSRLPRTTLDELSCDCAHIEHCRGGCRFRASIYNGAGHPDPVQCHRYGVVRTDVDGGGVT